MEVKVYHYYDTLPEDVKKIQDPPWNKEDYKCYLVIWWDNGEIQVETSPGEPEDNSYSRDHSWIAPALIRAYNDGAEIEE